jgi:tetratricopeptide (TPR) repeat protein
MKLKSPKSLLVVVLILIFVISPLFWLSQTSSVFQAKLMTLSISSGVRYYGRLQLWHLLAQANNWAGAAKIAPSLDPADIADYQNSNSPSALKLRYNNLMITSVKSANDYLEMAQIQARLNNYSLAIKLLDEAIAIDPTRPDLSVLRYQISH